MGGRAMFREGVALVVGGSGGIGRAVCEGLFEAGCDVALTYRNNAQAADKVVQTGKRQGRQVYAATLDLTDREATHTLVEDVAKRFGGIHTLVLATGADISMTYCSQIDPLEWDRTIAGDLTGAFNITLATLPYLRQGGGSIVAMTSAGLKRHPQKDILSVVPKAGLEALLRGIAREEGRFGIRANAIALGVIDTGLFHRLTDRLTPDFIESMQRNTALGRFGTPEEAADLAVFLASSRSSFVTGQSIALDGGFSV